MVSLNRLTGVLSAALGAALLLVVIPQNTEVFEGAWMQPGTIATVVAWILVVAGAVHALFPTGEAAVDWALTGRAALVLAACCLAIYLMSLSSFLAVAPVLAAAIMLFMREWRWHWLAIGAVVVPASLWAVCELALGRPLP